MASPCRRDFVDDSIKLEPKVVLALSRLSRLNKSARSAGIACKQVVEYLKAHYCHLDGDVESQVLTALLSCVKSGIICALDNGKYLLPPPGPKGIVSNCITRSSHGPKCSCSSVIKCVSKNYKKACCVVKLNADSTKRTKKASTKTRPSSKPPKRRTVCKPKPRKCAQSAQQVLEDGNACGDQAAEVEPKCNYCREVHPLQGSEAQKLCETCHPWKTGYVAPYDKFSPREEHSQVELYRRKEVK